MGLLAGGRDLRPGPGPREARRTRRAQGARPGATGQDLGALRRPATLPRGRARRVADGGWAALPRPRWSLPPSPRRRGRRRLRLGPLPPHGKGLPGEMDPVRTRGPRLGPAVPGGLRPERPGPPLQLPGQRAHRGRGPPGSPLRIRRRLGPGGPAPRHGLGLRRQWLREAPHLSLRHLQGRGSGRPPVGLPHRRAGLRGRSRREAHPGPPERDGLLLRAEGMANLRGSEAARARGRPPAAPGPIGEGLPRDPVARGGARLRRGPLPAAAARIALHLLLPSRGSQLAFHLQGHHRRPPGAGGGTGGPGTAGGPRQHQGLGTRASGTEVAPVQATSLPPPAGRMPCP